MVMAIMSCEVNRLINEIVMSLLYHVRQVLLITLVVNQDNEQVHQQSHSKGKKNPSNS